MTKRGSSIHVSAALEWAATVWCRDPDLFCCSVWPQ